VSEVAPSRGSVCFGAFEVDFRKGEVRKHGYRLRLQDQPFRILQILLEHPGELVTREEIQRRIWPADTFVDFEKGLNNAIRKLRDALGDSTEEPRFIETYSGRGYCFIASITPTNGASRIEEAVSPVEVSVPAPSRPLYRRLAVGAVVLLAFVATLFGFDIGGVREHWLTRASSPVIRSLAVLPLANLSNDPNQEYFSDGMTDALITDLAQIGSLKVISRTSTIQYKQTKKTLPEIARELNVDGIIEGTVQRSGDRVRITAQLIYGPGDKHMWANSYERDMRDIFTLEREVTSDVAHQVQARLTTSSQAHMSPPRPANPKVLDLYLMGNYHGSLYANGAGDDEKRKGAEYYQQAIEADPNFAPAYNGLANMHLYLLWPSDQDFEIARRMAERAVELDPNSSEAHVTLGQIKRQVWNWAGEEEEYRRAIALNANNTNAHDYLAYHLDSTGRLDEGWKESQTAQELDPDSDHLSGAYEDRGQYERAIAMRQIMVKRYPDDGYLHLNLFRDYVKTGMQEEALQEIEKTATLFGFPESALRIHHALENSGFRGAMRQYAGEMENLAATKRAFLPVNLAEVYASLGDKDRSFFWLEQAYGRRDFLAASTDEPLGELSVEFLLDPLHSDPRFKDLMRRVGLPP
jgi:TolB-like protein/DNA-binding winged helix-turn-helix (wHTH) protein/tetratricopeptide (TPR) repeat protein